MISGRLAASIKCSLICRQWHDSCIVFYTVEADEVLPLFADDFSVGQKFDLGHYCVSAGEIIEFAAKYDPQPYHLTEEDGKRSLFRGLVASGWHSAAIWMRLYVDTMLKGASVEGSPGVDELRWRMPVRPNDTLVGSVEIVNLQPNAFRQDVVTIFKKGELRRVGDAQPVVSLILQSRYKKRKLGFIAEKS